MKGRKMLKETIILATEAHHGQIRKNSGFPYITHPLAVMQTLIEYGVTDEETLCLALLHDVVEDCVPYYVEQIVKNDLYDDVFFEDLLSLTKEKNAFYTDRKLLKASPRAQLVKLADIEHNTREGELYKGYYAKKLAQVDAMLHVVEHDLWYVLAERLCKNNS